MNSPPVPLAICIRDLTRFFGHQAVLKGINLTVARGEVLTLLGPNGAGKTTLIKILATILKPSGGEVVINGLNLKQDVARIRQGLGVVSHTPFLYGELTAYENLDFYARLWRLTDSHRRIDELTHRLGIAHLTKYRVNTLSRGQQQRLSIARALLPDPALLLLDEPDASLDAEGMAVIEEIAREGRTVVLTTHNLELGLSLCSSIAILSCGRITHRQERGDTSLEELKQIYGAATKPRNGILV